MTNITVLTSTVADGSMLNRHNPSDAAVVNNRETFLLKYGLQLDNTTRLRVNTLMRATVEHDTNYCRYLEVIDADKGRGMRDDEAPVADALVTTEVNHVLILPVADCVAATFFDPINHVLMISHLGRHSLEQEGGTKSVQYLVKHHHTNPARLKVWLSPAPSKELYPIWALDNKGMKEVTFEQLAEAGVLTKNIVDNPAESDKDPNYYSYSEFLKGNRREDGDYMVVATMTD